MFDDATLVDGGPELPAWPFVLRQDFSDGQTRPRFAHKVSKLFLRKFLCLDQPSVNRLNTRRQQLSRKWSLKLRPRLSRRKLQLLFSPGRKNADTVCWLAGDARNATGLASANSIYTFKVVVLLLSGRDAWLMRMYDLQWLELVEIHLLRHGLRNMAPEAHLEEFSHIPLSHVPLIGST